MKTTELRIGNLVTVSDSIIKVTGVDRYNIQVNGYYPLSDIMLIPLTQEWLIKFGFLEQKQDWFNLNLINDWTYLYINAKYNIVELSVNNHGAILSGVCQYVHQLQNLYFALTGEELTCS